MYEIGYTGVGLITKGDARFSDGSGERLGKSIVFSFEALPDAVEGLGIV